MGADGGRVVAECLQHGGDAEVGLPLRQLRHTGHVLVHFEQLERVAAGQLLELGVPQVGVLAVDEPEQHFQLRVSDLLPLLGHAVHLLNYSAQHSVLEPGGKVVELLQLLVDVQSVAADVALPFQQVVLDAVDESLAYAGHLRVLLRYNRRYKLPCAG